jgi:hypothetical protein
MIKVYISGKITGTIDYLHRFERAEKVLSNYIVINPAKVNAQLPIETTWKEYMQMSMTMLKMCNAIYMLKGWEDSEGARLEYNYAVENNYKIIFEK